jgi:hypothetical protein
MELSCPVIGGTAPNRGTITPGSEKFQATNPLVGVGNVPLKEELYGKVFDLSTSQITAQITLDRDVAQAALNTSQFSIYITFKVEYY